MVLGGACLFSAVGCATHESKLNTANTASGSEAEANLTQAEAEARAEALADVTYQLRMELDEKSPVFSGMLHSHFNVTRLGAPLFLDLSSTARIQTMTINGRIVDQPAFSRHRLALPVELLKTGGNDVEIAYSQSYSHDGRGLHRFEDPEDHRVYLYSQFEAYDAHMMFPCFDQPDIKAKFTMTVVAPRLWQVISTTREASRQQRGLQQVWNFPQTAPISAYVFSLHAGPYHKWESRAGAIPLRLFARESLARYVKPEDWFTPTRQGLAFYGQYFDFSYPFHKYDQILAPEFNAGAMENVAAVTFSEHYVKRGSMMREDREHIASVILHEMAHMWFGDLTTMKWWNGLWLNESFATFMSALAMDQATEFKESWVSFHNEKLLAYYEDQLVTTHPIDGRVADTSAAFTSFDGITYGKGASVLKQLRFYLGKDRFRDGVRDYFKRFAYQNTRLEDFTGSLARASSADLATWSDAWLRQAGVDSLRSEYSCALGRITEFSLYLSGPEGSTVISPRAHRTNVAVFAWRGPKIVNVASSIVTVSGEKTKVTALVGRPCPEFVDLNADDQDYVKVQFDAKSLATVRDHYAQIAAPFTRNVMWPILFQMVRDRQISSAQFLDLLTVNFSKESNLKTLESLIADAAGAIDYLPLTTSAESERRLALAAKVESVILQKLRSAQPDSDEQKAEFRWLVANTLTQLGRDALVDYLSGKEKLNGLTFDQDRQWLMIVRLSSLGDPRVEPFLAAARKADRSDRGIESALQAEASRPQLDIKRQWWKKIVDNEPMPYSQQRAALRRILPFWQASLREQMAPGYLEAILKLSKSRDVDVAELFAGAFVPLACSESEASKKTEREIETFVRDRGSEVEPAILKLLRQELQTNQRCLAIRTQPWPAVK